jgi:hypothetical protein
MALFEALYGRKCRTMLYWNQTGESQVFGPEILQEAEKQGASSFSEAYLERTSKLSVLGLE